MTHAHHNRYTGLRLLGLAFIALIFGPLDASDIQTTPERSGQHLIRIGVLAHRPKEEILAQWRPTAEYLSKRVPQRHFEILPLSYAEMDEVLLQKTIDFVLTNPSHYILMEHRYGLTRVATQIAEERGLQLSHFGGVIVVRSDRNELQQLSDLKGKQIAAPDSKSLGGYQTQAALLLNEDVDITRQASLRFTDMPHDRAIEAVLAGTADAAFVRTGVIEGMVQGKKLSLSDIRVLHPQTYPNFPHLVSTQLYPEWPFAAMPHVDEALARKITIALFELAPNHPAARAGKCFGWTIPADYEIVRSLLRTLRLPPYDQRGPNNLQDFARDHPTAIALTVASLIFLLILLKYRSVQAVRLKSALIQQSRLATLGEMIAVIVHQWKQPLNTLSLLVQSLGQAQTQGTLTPDFTKQVIAQALAQIQHMTCTTDDFRNFFRPAQPRAPFDTMRAVGNTLKLLTPQLKSKQIFYKLTCHTHRVSFDEQTEIVECPEKSLSGPKNEFEHAILNLINNATDAILETRKQRGGHYNGELCFDFFSSPQQIEIRISDNGGGIDAKVLPRIFSPYFTTKPSEKGTGLGLYISKIIIEEHMKGTLSAANGENGAVFTIVLPRS